MKMSLTIQHGLPHDVVRRKLDARVAQYDKQYPQFGIAQSYRWVNDRELEGGARGASGKVTFGEGELHVELELPWLLFPFKGRIEHFIRQEVEAATKS